MRRILVDSRLRSVEIHVIRVCNHERHASLCSDPVKLSLPYVNSPFAEDDEEGEVLRKRIRKFHIPPMGSVLADPEGKYGPHSVGLWLERVRVESRSVIFDVQVVDPLQDMMHGRRTESHTPPLPEEFIYLDRLPPEPFSRDVQF